MTQCPSFAALCTEIAEGLKPGFGETETNSIGRMIAQYVRDPCQPAGHVEWEYEEKRVAGKKRPGAADDGEAEAKRGAPPAKRHARFEDKCGCSASRYDPRRAHTISVDGVRLEEAEPREIEAGLITLHGNNGWVKVIQESAIIRSPSFRDIPCPPPSFAQIHRLATRPMPLTPAPIFHFIAYAPLCAGRDTIWERRGEWPDVAFDMSESTPNDFRHVLSARVPGCRLAMFGTWTNVFGNDWDEMLLRAAELLVAFTRRPIDASAFECRSIRVEQEDDQRAHEPLPDYKRLRSVFPDSTIHTFPVTNVAHVSTAFGQLHIKGTQVLSLHVSVQRGRLLQSLPRINAFFEESAVKVAAGLRVQ
jgi:hypothetical protein